ncbi:MAG: NAD(P)/FAD-dependent oxidoreductase [Christensenellales bacterium]|jgi:glycerol-3-phosphate dehydrogenase|nr:NAD(P)/FAD-dependent oxidoreductase [Clostridiales bacterium]
MRDFDVAIIGGGVIGSAIARELMRYQLNVAVLEKESDVCVHTSGRNTGMLHAGFLYKPGSLKAKFAVEGNKEFDTVAKELDVPFKRTGKLIVGFTPEDRERLEYFIQRGKINGVIDMELIDRKRMDEIDSSAGGNFAVYCPSSGILDPFIYTIALAENAVNNGAEYFLNTEVIAYERLADDQHLLRTKTGEIFRARWVINSSGLRSAQISEMLGIPGYVIQLVKGEYFVLDKKAGEFAQIPVYPAPTPQFTFDTHATPTVDGNVLVGPNSINVEDGEDYSVSQEGMDGLQESGKKMFKHMKREYYIRTFAGARPKLIDPETGQVQDFVVQRPENTPGIINLVGIESPGLTCALPIARRVVKLLKDKEELTRNPAFNPVRKGIVRFHDKTTQEKARLIQKNPDYGEIVCRCETITRAEIVQALHNPLGVSTVNGVKMRTRASMGRCQGGYCEMRITALIREELGKEIDEVTLTGCGSEMFTGAVKGGMEE